MTQDRPPVASRTGAGDPPPAEAAAEHLRYIREVMARSGTFTAVPGRGSMAMGLTAVVAAVVAGLQPTPERWLAVWLGSAVVAATVGGWAMYRKARAGRVPLLTGTGRRYVLGLLPALVAGGLLTLALVQAGSTSLLPGLWMLLYGTALMAAGAYSIRLLPLMGLGFLIFGTVALFAPFPWSNVLLGLGFGGLHLLFGWIIATRHGG